MQKLIVFDTTLRDGEQAAGTTLNRGEKLEIARQLEKLGIDVIEAGFPISSPGDFEAVKLISHEIKNASVCALARANTMDIDRAWEAIKQAVSPRIHLFISASHIQMAHQLHKSPDEVFELATRMVAHASRYTRDVEFSPMDASRADPRFIFRLVEAAITAGATTVNIPDTVGYAMPDEFAAFILPLLTTWLIYLKR
jgi:2-isopropylmalate synthase